MTTTKVNKNIIVILAAGEGKRMASAIPKVLHIVGDKPMLLHVLEEAQKTKPEKIYIIVGKHMEQIQYTLQQSPNPSCMDNVIFVRQPHAYGTGNALMCSLEYMLKTESYDNDDVITVLSGDVPLIQHNTIQQMFSNFVTCDARILVTTLENPFGYGRIVENNGKLQKIVEEKDCIEDEAKITKINCGMYSFRFDILKTYLPQITTNNAQGEYYLTDIFEIILQNNKNANIDMTEIPCSQQHQIYGINTPSDLIKVEHILGMYSDKTV